ALRYAIDYPNEVKSISVIDSVSEYDALLELFVKQWKALAATGNAEHFFWGMMPSIYGTSFIQNNMDTLTQRAEMAKKLGPDYLKAQITLYETFLKDVDFTEELANINCPALIVCGEQDMLKPVKYSRIMAEAIPHSEFAIIPDCGHVTIMEKPHVLNSLLLGFVTKHS
ncbi:MAG: alpha/beta hydrolase, partial [Spirochaetaceae bacterium]